MGPENRRREKVCTPPPFDLGSTCEQTSTPTPGEVRHIILGQHAKIRSLLRSIEGRAIALLAGPVPNVGERETTRKLTLLLCSVMVSHIELENRILVAAVTDVDAWGPVRAEQLRTEHAQQLHLLRTYANSLEHESFTDAALALTAAELVQLITTDMEHEEASVLSPDLLSDGAIGGDVETG